MCPGSRGWGMDKGFSAKIPDATVMAQWMLGSLIYGE